MVFCDAHERVHLCSIGLLSLHSSAQARQASFRIGNSQLRRVLRGFSPERGLSPKAAAATIADRGPIRKPASRTATRCELGQLALRFGCDLAAPVSIRGEKTF